MDQAKLPLTPDEEEGGTLQVTVYFHKKNAADRVIAERLASHPNKSRAVREWALLGCGVDEDGRMTASPGLGGGVLEANSLEEILQRLLPPLLNHHLLPFVREELPQIIALQLAQLGAGRLMLGETEETGAIVEEEVDAGDFFDSLVIK